MIWTNSTFKLVFAPGDNADDLAMYSALAGERRKPTGEREPVLPPATIRTLGQWQVLVLHGTMKPAIGCVRPVWERRDVRRADRAARREDRRPRATRSRAFGARLLSRIASRLAPDATPSAPAAHPAGPSVPAATQARDTFDRELEAMLASTRDGER
jgi:hypothetical protein